MTDDDLDRKLHEAFDAAARASVSDSAPTPPPRFATTTGGKAGRRRVRLLAPIAAAAAVVAVVVSVTALQDSPRKSRGEVVGGHLASSKAAPVRSASTAPLSTRSPGEPVHIKLLNADGATYGVGMPLIAFLSKKITSGKALQDTTTATVNGTPVQGAWYFEHSSYYKGYPLEAHWRPQDYWPAHAKIHVDIPAKGLAAGNGLSFDDSLTSDFTTGARHVSVVNDVTHRMTVTTDGKTWDSVPVSLGGTHTPTTRGIKVIMEKGRDIAMRGPGYSDPHVQYTQRLTYSGEYLHAAPWNMVNISRGIDSSNGCTNLLPSDAVKLYDFLQVGDVVDYPDAKGPPMTVGSGYGDWNVPWTTWTHGGLVPTT
jgi:lipoprotein-anchoring transpeptidase ErfK/SrfK